MNYNEGPSKAGEYLRLTLAYLAKYNLSANPVNYTVWYDYVSGKNLKLRRALDRTIEARQGLDDKTLELLYQKFVTDGDRIVISKLLTKINLMLREITSHVVETEGDLSGHGQALNSLANELGEVRDYDGIRIIIDRMIQETKALIHSGSRLQNRMKVSSEDLRQLNQELEKAQKEAQSDALTGLLNRRGLDKRFELERIRARQNTIPFSIILIDIDHFKRVNDTFGHLVGDSLLRGFAKILRALIRKNDVAARYGGEEFLLLLPETDLSGAAAVGEKIRTILAAKEWKLKESGESMGRVTVSMGIAQFDLHESGTELVDRADTALYRAKSGGRDQIITQNEL